MARGSAPNGKKIVRIVEGGGVHSRALTVTPGAPMKYEEWERVVPAEIRTDPLWSLRVYRVALYAAHLAQADGRRLAASPVTERVAGRLVAAATSIGAQIAEASSRFSRRERAHHYECALGSARECRDWYLRGKAELGENTVHARIATLTAIAKVLLVLIDRTRPGPRG